MANNHPPGTILTVAGTGVLGYDGDGGRAVATRLNWPRAAVVDRQGNLFIADTNNHRVRKVDRDGLISTVAGTGEPGYDGDGGPAVHARLNAPRDVEVAPDGTLFIADTGNHCVRRVTADGIITTVAGTGESGGGGGGGPALQVQLSWPQDIALAPDGAVIIADTGNHRVRRLTPTGEVVTIAGAGECGFGGDGGKADLALLTRPRGVVAAADGSLFIGDTENHRIRRVSPEGVIDTVAGCGKEGFSGDGGPAVEASLRYPRGVAVTATGMLFVADCDNSRVRRVDATGTITTVAGTGCEGYSGDGGPACAAELADPHGLSLTPEGHLLIGEPRNHCIRLVWHVCDWT